MSLTEKKSYAATAAGSVCQTSSVNPVIQGITYPAPLEKIPQITLPAEDLSSALALDPPDNGTALSGAAITRRTNDGAARKNWPNRDRGHGPGYNIPLQRNKCWHDCRELFQKCSYPIKVCGDCRRCQQYCDNCNICSKQRKQLEFMKQQQQKLEEQQNFNQAQQQQKQQELQRQQEQNKQKQDLEKLQELNQSQSQQEQDLQKQHELNQLQKLQHSTEAVIIGSNESQKDVSSEDGENDKENGGQSPQNFNIELMLLKQQLEIKQREIDLKNEQLELQQQQLKFEKKRQKNAE